MGEHKMLVLPPYSAEGRWKKYCILILSGIGQREMKKQPPSSSIIIAMMTDKPKFISFPPNITPKDGTELLTPGILSSPCHLPMSPPHAPLFSKCMKAPQNIYSFTVGT